MTDSKFEELYNAFDSMTKKDMATNFNKLNIDDRIDYLFRLSQDSKKACDDFVDDIYEGGRQLRANYERDLILQGKSTREWTPHEIESIMNFIVNVKNNLTLTIIYYLNCLAHPHA